MKRFLLPSLIVLALAAGWSFAAEVTDLDTTDASNTNSTFGLEDTTPPSQVADRYQAYQGAMARYIADQASGLTVNSTSSTAYTVSANNTTTDLIDGWMLVVEMTPTNGVSASLNINGTGAKTLEKVRGTSLSAGDIIEGSRILVSYDQANDVWLVLGGLTPPTSAAEVHTSMVQDSTPQLGGDLDVQTYDIVDGSGNQLVEFVTSASAVNHIVIQNSATTATPSIEAGGSDTNVGLRLRGKGTGPVQLGDADLEFPDSDGTSGQVLSTNGAGALSFIDDGGAFATTDVVDVSGGIDALFTNIPSGVTYIVVSWENISFNTADNIQVRLGDSGGVEATGYTSMTMLLNNGDTPSTATDTTSCTLENDTTANLIDGQMTFVMQDASNNQWVAIGMTKLSGAKIALGVCEKSLSGEVTQLEFIAQSTKVFDDGTVSIRFQ